MERNDWNYVTIPSLDLGNLISITVQRDNSGNGPDWFLDRIVVASFATACGSRRRSIDGSTQRRPLPSSSLAFAQFLQSFESTGMYKHHAHPGVGNVRNQGPEMLKSNTA